MLSPPPLPSPPPMPQTVVQLLLVAAAAARVPAPPFPLSAVDVYIGTGSSGWGIAHNNPGAQHPFGALRLGPDTAFDDQHPRVLHFSGYYYPPPNDKHRIAFADNLLPDLANVGVMPVRVAVPTADLVANHNYRTPFRHETEQAFPGYYGVELDAIGVTAELVAAGTHAGLHRYSYGGAAGPRTLLIDACHSVDNNNNCYDAAVNISVTDAAAGRATVHTRLRYSGSLTGVNGRGIDIFVVLRIRTSDGSPLTGYGVWQNGVVIPGVAVGAAATSGSLGAFLSFGADGNMTLDVSAGLSFVSAAHAEQNDAIQIAGRNFDTVLAATTELWRGTMVNALDATAPRASDVTKLYTALYRTFMSPTVYSEADGSYMAMNSATQVVTVELGHHHYSDMSLWDTYRTQNPWLVLVNPPVAVDIARSLVAMGEQGSVLPRWPIANVYTACMFGDNANMVLLDTYVKGLTDFNLTSAYAPMKASAIGPVQHDVRDGLQAYLQFGYVPHDVLQAGTCNTLAFAYNDWALGRVAALLGNDADAAIFDARGKNYRNVWDPETLFMCPRFQNGTFDCPRFLQYPYSPDYVEGNAWHYSWDVPHDLSGMLALWPSADVFLEKLETNLRESFEQGFLIESNWLPNPYYWAGNEHDLLIPWLFHIVGRTDRTQYWTRRLLEHRYTDLPSGLPGNDDYGTLSAWYAWGALGFYPLAGEDWYFIGSPVVSEARVRGGALTVVAVNQSPENVYVERLERNGVPFTSAYVTHAELTSGATFTFYMTDIPDTPYNRGNDGATRWAGR